MVDPAVVTHAFDDVAPRYDASFTDGQLGRNLRHVVWRELASVFASGDTVLDLGCGTGEDACFLARQGISVIATDASSGMLATATSKARQRGVEDRIAFRQLDLLGVATENSLASLVPGAVIDGAYSNFGPLNCLPDRRSLSRAFATVVKPGGTFIAVVMGPVCPWEVAWYLLHAHPRTAVRRFRRGVSAQVGTGEVRVWYPSARRLRKEFQPHFAHIKTVGLGVFLPPSDLGYLVTRAPKLFERLNALDERTRSTLLATWFNDHYLSVFRRQDEGRRG